MECLEDPVNPRSCGALGRPLRAGCLESESDLDRGWGGPHQAGQIGNSKAARSSRLLFTAENCDSLWKALSECQSVVCGRFNPKTFRLRQLITFVELAAWQLNECNAASTVGCEVSIRS